MSNESEISVLFVCMGNICRSPTAEGVFRELLRSRAPGLPVHIDSAGTHGYHIGQAPDGRTQAAALARGIDLSGQRARRVVPADYERFSLILAMDSDNLETLREAAPAHAHERIRLFLEFAAGARVRDVPDPFYGGTAGFERVLDLVEEAAEGLLAQIVSTPR